MTDNDAYREQPIKVTRPNGASRMLSDVPCLKCGAAPGAPCRRVVERSYQRPILKRYHKERGQ